MNKSSDVLQWLNGTQLTEVKKEDYSWLFSFGNGGFVSTEQVWRLLTSNGITVTSEDNGHKFGLPAPVDAAKAAMEIVGTNRVQAYHFSKGSSDLVIDFDGAVQLQFLNLSSGYESWHAVNEGVHLICQGGGNLSIYDEKLLPSTRNIIRPQSLKL